MQRTKVSARVLSFILTLAMLLSVFSIFAFAAESTDEVSPDELSIAFNRTFSEGWDYTNGIVDALAKENTAGLAYEYRNLAYNYYLRLDKQNTKVSYLYIDTQGMLAKEGKTFIELDVTSGANCAMGQAIRVSVRGDIKTLVEFRDDGMYILGENVGTSVYDLKWESLGFIFDFDYASAETLDTAYKVTAYHNNQLLAEQVWKYGQNGAGISQLRFAFGDTREASIGSWYGVDNVKIYSGVDDFTMLDTEDYGLAVDDDLPKDFNIAGNAADPDGYLRGTPSVERLDSIGTALVHYNRTFDEGWSLSNGSTAYSFGNNVDIRSEKTLDGDYNYFYRFRALVKEGGYLEVPVVDYPTDEALYVEFDLKAGVNANLGGIFQVCSDNGNSIYALSIKNGQLYIFDTPAGYVGSDWLHIILVFSNEVNEESVYTCNVYYGAKGALECTYDVGVITNIKIGGEAGPIENKYGDWYGVDNLQIYSGTSSFITIPSDEYGVGVDALAPKDFVLEDATTPEAPIDPDGGSNDNAGDDFEINVDSERLLKGSPNLDRIEILESNPDDIWIRYNRHYGEGWDFAVGGGSNGKAIMKLEAEQCIDLTYNYYQYYEQSQGTTNAYWTFSTGANRPKSGSMFFEFDIKAVEGCNVGGIMQLRELSGSNNPYIMEISNGYLITNISGAKKLGKLNEDNWAHVAIEFDFDYAIEHPDKVSSPGQYMIRIWVGDSTYYEALRNTGSGGFGVEAFRMGFEGSSAENDGQFFCLDNMQMYGGDKFAILPTELYGEAVNTSTEKDFPIQTTSVSLDTMVEESLFMKIGSEYGLVEYERTPNLVDANGKAYGCPTLIDGTVWVPLEVVLNFLSYPIYEHKDEVSYDISTGSKITYITIGKNSALVGGVKVDLTAAPSMITDKLGYEFLAVTLDDLAILFPDFYVGCDDMNMVTFSKYETISSGTISQSIRIDLMKKFLFEYLTADEFYERAAEYTNNFDHPYLITNQARFDELSAVWYAGRYANDADPSNDLDYEYDEVLYSYVNASVNQARGYYNRYTGSSTTMTLDHLGLFNTQGEVYEGLHPNCYIYDSEATSLGLRHPYKSTAGYDPVGGRLNPPFDPIEPFAYAYQVTKDIRFAQMAYEFCEILCDWDHWGPGHFLNCADTAASIAVAYDWCYDAWVELGLDVDRIADGLFYHGTLQGYLVSIGSPDPHGRAGGNGSNYTTMVNNWNPVCTAGIAASALATMSYTGYSVNTKLAQPKAALRAEVYGGTMVREVSASVLSMNYKTLISAALDIYAPDGSYEESVSYWGYGANNLFRYCQILESSIGDDLGLMDTWGIDRTCYSIMHMVSSDFRCFAYNDGSVGGGCSSGQFSYVAQSVGDDFIRVVRRMHIVDGGFGVSHTDSIFYKYVDPNAELNMPLQYHHVGIHGYTMRSSWERGAIFAGMLGGDNDDGHGHIDAGQWIYYNKGIPFIEDIGPDGYNTYNYFSNNNMYKTNPEGHSVILISSDPVNLNAGQLRSSVSPVISTGNNDHGAYVTIDTRPAYGSKYLLTSKRGMLFTNDRKTVIVQDEIVPNGSHTLWWLCHYSTENIASVEIANNGRTAYLTSKKSSLTGQPVVLRINMVSAIPGIKFEKLTAYDFLLEKTMRPGDSEAMGKNPEGDRSHWLKLAVKLEGLMLVDFAVALEVIDPSNPVLTGYKFTTMNEWDPYADTRVVDDTVKEEVEVVVQRGTAKPSDLVGYANRLKTLVEEGTHFEQLSEFYTAITQMTYTVNKLGRERFETSDTFTESLALYDEYYELYNTYFNDTRTTTECVFALTDLLSAAKVKAVAPEESE